MTGGFEPTTFWVPAGRTSLSTAVTPRPALLVVGGVSTCQVNEPHLEHRPVIGADTSFIISSTHCYR